MSGFENDVMVSKNLNFDASGSKPHLGIINSAGKLPIGTGNTSPTPEILAGSLISPNGTISIGYSSPNITLDTTGINDLHTARFIVASSTAGTGANFTTIAAAIAAAQGTGVNSTIFLQPGTYTENFTLPPGINLAAYDGDSLTPNATIVGTITMTAAGSCSISGIRLQTNSAAFLAVTGSAASVMNLKNCFLNATNNNGITFSSSSASAIININDCNGNIGSNTSFFAHTSAGIINFNNSSLQNGGASTTQSTCSAGLIVFRNSFIIFPITTSSTGVITANGTSFNCQVVNTTALTCGGGTSIIINSDFAGGSASALSVGVTLGLVNSNISSTNTNAITGAGTLNYSSISFSNTSSLINVTTQVPLVTSNDAIKITTPGAYPYTTVPQDAFIKVDTSAARTIIPLASPTTGQKHIIKDTVGSAGTNNITVTPSGKNIDGAASYTMNVNYASITIVFSGTEWSIT